MNVPIDSGLVNKAANLAGANLWSHVIILLSGAMPDFKNPFKSPDIFVKLRNDPRTADMLNDPEGMKLIQALQTNPNALG